MAAAAALCLLLLVLGASSETVEWPQVRLRTRLLQPRDEVERQQRRRLAGLPAVVAPQRQHHTSSAEWGALHEAHQLLLTHRPGLGHAGQEALLTAVEEAGASVAGYLPDSTWLLVAPAGGAWAADALAAHSDVLWLGLHDEQDKLAPEWESILQQLRAAAPALDRLGVQAREQQRRAQPWANASLAIATGVDELSAALPVATRWDDKTGQLLVGALVHFPGLVAPRRAAAAPGSLTALSAAEAAANASAAAGSGGEGSAIRRARRIALQRAAQDAGAAAVADWGPVLAQRFGARVQRGGPDSVVVLAPAGQLDAALQWLARRPAVHWVAPSPRLRLNNKRVTVIAQSAMPPSESADLLDPTYHPLWAAGITGSNQVVGCGDSGVDIFHCFFTDPNVDLSSFLSYEDGVKTFNSPTHRKIRYYRAYGDTSDANGHGTHVVGTLVGFPYGYTLDQTTDITRYSGMAPDAKVAFIDLSDSSSDSIFTPSDLINGYFKYTSEVGAAIHSDSWGSDSIYYDSLAAQVDQYSWDNPEFLPVIAAGNYGDKVTPVGSSGDVTVTSPANAKNCLSVGATQTSGESMDTTAVQYKVWDATLSQGQYNYTFRVMEAKFGADASTLVGPDYPIAVASPLDACAPLSTGNASLSGTIVLVQRGTCLFSEKALAAQNAGAAGVLIYDNNLGAYFPYSADQAVGDSVTIPVLSVTRRIGQTLVSAVSTGKAVSLSFSTATLPQYSFENLASYSSQGPTPDFRVKPDIVAPGTITSAKVDYSSTQDCGLVTYAGTSMATPVTAGSAILLRQYFMDGFYPSGAANPDDSITPSGALIKAVMLGGAATITGFEADTGLPLDPPPSFRQGFGRVFTGNSVFLANRTGSPQVQLLDAVPINQDETHTYCVRASGGPFTVTLVWTDYPAQTSANKALVHDLDLQVRAAGLSGIPLLGNGGSVSDPNTPDRENNVEQVALDSLPAGAVSISVRGASIFGAAGAPAYALVINGNFTGTLVKPGDAGSSEQCTIVVANITSGPMGLTSADPIVFTFSSQNGVSSGISWECKLGDAAGNITDASVQHDWRACTSPATYSALPDGSYQFAVRAQGEDIATTQNFVKDTVPPTVVFTRAGSAINPLSLNAGQTAPSSTPDATALFEFSGTDTSGVNFTCTVSANNTLAAQPPVYAGAARLDTQAVFLGQPFNCSSPLPVFWILPAAWQLQVVGVDGAGNKAAPQNADWTVAFVAGQQYTRFLEGPYGRQPKTNLTFTFAAFDSTGAQLPAPGGFECWLESTAGGGAAAYSPCNSPYTLPDSIQDGDYRFHARLAGVAPSDGTEAVSNLTIDSVAPTVTITEAPEPVHQGNTTAVQFSASEEGASFYCGLARSDPGAAAPSAPTDPSSFAPCSSPDPLSNLTDGSYAFAVYAVDDVGNQGTPATTSFLIDTTPPSIDVQMPGATSQTSITVTFTVTDLGSGVQNVTCRFRGLTMADGNSSSSGNGSGQSTDFAACTSPKTYSGLQEGRYGLTLRAADKAGLVNQTQEYDVFVDFTPPVVSSQGFPELGVTQPSTVTFHLAELSNSPPDSTSNVTVYQTLVQVVSNASDFTALQSAWRSRGSSGSPGSTTLSEGAGRRRSLLDSSTGGGEGTVLPASAVGTWRNCTATCTYSGLSSGQYSLQVRGIDAAGNVGNASQPYPFEVDASLDQSSSSFPVWAIAACAVGGALVLGLLGWLFWRCCCARPAAPRPGSPAGAMSASSYTYSAGGYSHTNGAAYSSGYPSPGGYPPPAAANGAWGYNGYPQQQAAPYQANGYANGGTYRGPVPTDPIEQQRLALAQAQASSRRSLGYPGAPGGGGQTEEREVAAAIEASLREQHSGRGRPSEDEQLRAAIQASLRDQQQRQSWGRNGWQ